ncbi:MAG: Fic family protein [Deltaproteobacteria bacterium]|nr:Fic family protein [Deltaproteobacteria bacterium]
MKSLEPGFIERQPISQQLIGTIRLLGEYKGRETLFKQQKPQFLETLRQVAVIQSTESSNRIEGITVPVTRIRKLMEQKISPQDRSEQEIAGYRDVLGTIHANHPNIPFTPNVVLQLHRDLYNFIPQEGGRWKLTDNSIMATRPDGTKIERFSPVPAHLAPEAMNCLHQRLNDLWDAGEIDHLLLIPSYVLDFLCIHPFLDGNGRMARLLTLLLLYRAGYEVGRYVSLEKVIEDHREGYYESLYRSSQGWHEGTHSLASWWGYFLGVVLLGAYRELEDRMKLIESGKGEKSALVLDVLGHLIGEFSVSDVRDRCPSVGIDLIRKILRHERKAGRVQCLGRGPNARWRRI